MPNPATSPSWDFSVAPEPATSDELYETYRRGLIERHICLNGRLDQFTWLRQTDPTQQVPRRLGRNKRSRVESYFDAKTNSIESGAFHWLPMHHEPKDPSQVPIGWGGGDNPILHGGLALASFSMESLAGVTSHASLPYAHQIFRFLLASEIPGRRRGMLLRRNSVGKDATLASTDEMLGLCIGLLYYVSALDSLGDATRAEEVRSFVKRIAKCVNAHGFWMLPYAEDLETAKNEGLLLRDFRVPMSRQTGFIFAYPFSLFFRKILGDDCPEMSCQWNDDEFDRYFPESIIDTGNISDSKWMALAKLVEAAEPSAWDYAVNTAVGVLVGGTFGPIGAGIGAFLGLGATAAADINLEWDDHGFFVNTLKLAEDYFDPHNNPARRAFRYVLDQLAHIDEKLEEDPFNLHLLGLATILAIECNAKTEVCDQAGSTFTALLEVFAVHAESSVVDWVETIVSGGLAGDGSTGGIRLGEHNALFALIAARCGQDSTEVQQAVDILCRTTGWPAFQHDLPLGSFQLFDLLAQQPGNEEVRLRAGYGDNNDDARRCAVNGVRGTISRLLGERAEQWWADYRQRRVPSNFNPDWRWGEGNTWEHKSYPDNCINYEKPAHVLIGQRWKESGAISFVPEGVTCDQVARALVDERHRGMSMAIEGDGLDLLLPRMLAGYWGVLPVPSLNPDTRETLWPTLPYLGVSPRFERLPTFSASVSDLHRCRAGAWPQKRLVALRPRDSKSCLPIEGFSNGYYYGGGYRWGGQHTILNKTFRGARRHRYEEVLPALHVKVADGGPRWQFYVEIADCKTNLTNTPTWQPAADSVYDAVAHVVRSRVRDGVAAWPPKPLALDEIDPGRLATTLDSSIFVWQIRARQLIEGSIGNETFDFSISGSQAFWLRMNQLPPAGSRCEVVLNPHQGTLHGVHPVVDAHLDGARKAFNVLWLPISLEVLKQQSDIGSAIANLIEDGELRSGQAPKSLRLGRRDAYELLPTRFIQYCRTHAAQAERRNQLNIRHLHFCSYCFS